MEKLVKMDGPVGYIIKSAMVTALWQVLTDSRYDPLAASNLAREQQLFKIVSTNDPVYCQQSPIAVLGTTQSRTAPITLATLQQRQNSGSAVAINTSFMTHSYPNRAAVITHPLAVALPSVNAHSDSDADSDDQLEITGYEQSYQAYQWYARLIVM